ncbi:MULTISPECIES: AAA family ATPase [unclassified Paenibacillus]|uniref:AAA family ATPase n=1 Tax=unclassified Paenibacillus TaxID=185978 RepID=UPI002405E3E1|nr:MULTISPECIES: AAA family ATPase [unclassified Paenibacillus]MDF9841664.1 shikimate kinase [Paenibacillus sp. PastF-2]MDF9848224.1 shikimate kinase [Paenibacillus sp. PastM-2]MDF9854823.1 shikimate kinase [Paenibacillus sp. PastF-1]MDH6480093.1 shikimate kinase [Paenibacillus sp. PastH-2]
MKLIIVFGPQASGKMTIGHELEKITELKLFHNHMTIELLVPFFGFSPEMWRLVDKFRQDIFETAAGSGLYGMIFTYVWAFDLQNDWDYIESVCRIIEDRGGEVYLVELETALEERLERNKTPHRLEHKPTKRDVARSEQNLLQTMEQHRLNSHEGEITRERYLRINNTSLSAAEVAQRIKESFQL